MTYILMTIFAALILFLDQFTKYLTVSQIPLGSVTEFIPGFIGFSYVQNTGGAWGMFSGAIWLFAGIFLLFAVFIVWEFSKKRLPFTTFERWCIVAVFAGGLGNMIDRLRLGFVVDMIKTQFMDFPVFNVADCFITCGCILLLVHLAFFNKEFWKDEKK